MASQHKVTLKASGWRFVAIFGDTPGYRAI